MIDPRVLTQNILQALKQQSVGYGSVNSKIIVQPNPDGTVTLGFEADTVSITIAEDLAKAVATGVAIGLAPFLADGGELEDHKVSVDALDETANGSDYLFAKVINGARTTWTVDTSGGRRRIRVDIDTSGIDDHKVLVTSSDTTPDYLNGKLAAGHGTSTRVVTDPGTGAQGLAADLNFYAGPMTPVGSDDPGPSDDYTVPHGKHSHPLPNPAQDTYTLFPCYITDPRNKGDVYGVATGIFACGDFDVFSGWTQVAPGVMRRDTAGYMQGWCSDFNIGVISPISPYSTAIGQTILVWAAGGADSQLFGLYVIEDAGMYYDVATSSYVNTYAQIRRALGFTTSPDYLDGLTVHTLNGLIYGNKYFTFSRPNPFTLGLTAQTWTNSSSYTPASPKSELLSSAQFISEGATSDTQEAWASVDSFAEPSGRQVGPVFESLPIGVSSISAGPFHAWALLRTEVFSTCFVEVRWWIKHQDGTESSPFLTIWSAPVMSTLAYVYDFGDNLSAPVTTSPTDRVRVAMFAHSSEAPSVGQKVYWTFQNSARDSRFTVTWAGSIVGGTNRHQDLIDIIADVSVGDEPRHPACAIGAGRFHTPFTAATYDAGTGVVTPSADTATARGSNVARVALTGDLRGIDSTGWGDGDSCELYASGCSVGTPHTLVSDASVLAPAFPIRTTVVPGTTTYISPSMKAPMMRLKFRLDRATHVWWLERISG